MPKRVVKRFRYEAEVERQPLSAGQERRIRRSALESAPQDLAEWHSAATDIDRFYAAPQAAMAAYHLDDQPLAARIAREALDLAQLHREDWNYGNAVHFAHTVLGLLALNQGQLADAVAELHKSGETPGSPQLNSFGPSIQLARALLQRGERDAVLHYFGQCKRFWKLGMTWLTIWEKKVQRGAEPTFLSQLYR